MLNIRTVAAVVALSLSAVPAAYAGGIPVFDSVSIATRTTEHIATIERWRRQFERWERQHKQIERDFEALNGARNLGEILQDRRLTRYLPDEWQDLIRATRRAGKWAIPAAALAIVEETGIGSNCADPADEERQSVCEARATKGAVDQAYALDVHERTNDRVDQIDGLMKMINQTNDPKAIAEMQARIGAEQAMIANQAEATRQYAAASAAEDEILAQMTREIESKPFSSRVVAEFPAIDFGAE